jgi:hypothetical protein
MMGKPTLCSLTTKLAKDSRWPLDCALARIDEFEEVIVLAKRRGSNGFVRFSSGIRGTFFWIGVLEAMKRILFSEGLTNEGGE